MLFATSDTLIRSNRKSQEYTSLPILILLPQPADRPSSIQRPDGLRECRSARGAWTKHVSVVEFN